MVEPGVRRPRIDQVGKSQLPDVPEPLVRRRVHQADRHGVQSNGVPQGIADDSRGRGLFHDASVPIEPGRGNAEGGPMAAAPCSSSPGPCPVPPPSPRFRATEPNKPRRCRPRRMFTPEAWNPAPVTPSPSPSPDAPIAPWAARVRAEARNRPGVYRFLGPRGEPLYVGKSVQLRNRLLSWLRGDDRKATELLRVTHGLEWEYLGSEFEAVLREFRLIRELRPRFNVVHRRDRTFAWIRLTAEPAPRLVATLRPGAGPTRRGGRRRERTFGPFPARRSLPRDLEALAAVLGLRDCAGSTPMHFADQVDLWGPSVEPGCARAELGTCPAPCAAGCSEDAYQARVNEAVAFLEGRSDAPLEALDARMLDAAEREAFEFAARCRDRIERLNRLRTRIVETGSRIERLTFVYETGSPTETPRHHLVRRGQVLFSFDAPGPGGGPPGRGSAGHDLASRIREAIRAPAPQLAGLDDEAREELFIVTRWFRTHPEEEGRTTPIPAYLSELGSPG
ncbi:MAG: hypothetical protein EA350_13035 [Gemmatimonadales bacterium]|nr:MAG: hypothetical protein EA350_13035 [Gemmatimonadales bacterium]